jgi:glycosyltransferase involved in cell wall biosynthesis
LKGGPLEIAVILDSPDEVWPSMDLVGEMLVEQWRRAPSDVIARELSLPIPRMVRRFAADGRLAFNLDRALTRYLAYPIRAAMLRASQFFHVADHSYAHIVRVLPGARTGVYCHDIDAFRAVLAPKTIEPSKSSLWHRALARTLLGGLRSAAVIFYSTRSVGDALEAHGFASTSRLVHAPYGVSDEFTPSPQSNDRADDVLASLGGRPFVLHVGSSARRKRLDVLFETFARLRAIRPELRLVQQGAVLSEDQRTHIGRLRIADAILQPAKVDRNTLAGLYRRASVVLATSDAEGFGFPVLEALACGAIVVASDIAPFIEVGGDAAVYAPVGNVEAWSAAAASILDGSAILPPKERRVERAARFTWHMHAQTILDAYRDLA